MKKILVKMIFVVITLVILNTSLFSAPADLLGNFRSSHIVGYNVAEGIWVSILYYQFGMVIRGYGGDIVYLYGQEDLPDLTKQSIEENNKYDNSINKNLHVYVYEADDVSNPIHKQHVKVNSDIGYDLQNMNLNLEKGRLYMIVFRNENGKVLDIKKIMLAK